MAVRLNDQFLEQLRDRIDIEELIGEYVDLKRAGRLTKGLCPFHSEKTPSFVVYPDTQSYYCFGCTKGGDAITFIRDIENLDYIEAVKLLADRAGLAMPDEQYDDSLIKKKKRMLEMNKEAARFFNSYMHTDAGKAGLNYWRNRGLTDTTITHFGLGFAPNDWDSFTNHMRSKGYSGQELLEADLVRKSTKTGKVYLYPTFRNRVMTPIIDLRGNVVAFGGRVLDDSKPKYLNTSDTLIYKKGQNLFALNFAKASGKDSLILCEGYMDVITLHQYGFTNSVAGLGTALTDEQVRLLSHYCDKIYLSYDSDGAGQKALDSALEKLSHTSLSIHPLKLEGGKDPDEILKTYGPERWKTILSGAMNEIEYKLLLCKEGLDLSTDDGRVKFLRKAVPILASLGAIEKDIYTIRLSEDLGVSKDAIKQQVKEAERRQTRQTTKLDFSALGKPISNYRDNSVQPGVGIRKHKAEEMLVAIFLRNPDFSKKIAESKVADFFDDDAFLHMLNVVVERLSSGQSIELSYLSSEFSPEEMGKLSKLLNDDKLVIVNPSAQLDECIKTIKEETESAKKKSVSPSALSDDDFKNRFN